MRTSPSPVAVAVAAALLLLPALYWLSLGPAQPGGTVVDVGAAAARDGKVKLDLHIMSICPGPRDRRVACGRAHWDADG